MHNHHLFTLTTLIATSTALPPFLRQIFPFNPDNLRWPSFSDADFIDEDTYPHITSTIFAPAITTTSTITLVSAHPTAANTITTTSTSTISPTTATAPSTPRISCNPSSSSSHTQTPNLLLSTLNLRHSHSLLSSYALQLADAFCSSVPSDTDFHHRTLPLRIPVPNSHSHSSSPTSDSDADADLQPLSRRLTPALLTFTFDGATTTTVSRHRFDITSYKAGECAVGCGEAMRVLLQECGGGSGVEDGSAAGLDFETATLDEKTGEGEGQKGCGKWGVWVKWLSEKEMRKEEEKMVGGVGWGVEGEGEEEVKGDGRDAWRVELK